MRLIPDASAAIVAVEGLPVDITDEAAAAAEAEAEVLATLFIRVSMSSSKPYNSVVQVLLVDAAEDLLDLLVPAAAAVVVVVLPDTTATAVAMVL